MRSVSLAPRLALLSLVALSFVVAEPDVADKLSCAEYDIFVDKFNPDEAKPSIFMNSFDCNYCVASIAPVPNVGLMYQFRCSRNSSDPIEDLCEVGTTTCDGTVSGKNRRCCCDASTCMTDLRYKMAEKPLPEKKVQCNPKYIMSEVESSQKTIYTMNTCGFCHGVRNEERVEITCGKQDLEDDICHRRKMPQAVLKPSGSGYVRCTEDLEKCCCTESFDCESTLREVQFNKRLDFNPPPETTTLPPPTPPRHVNTTTESAAPELALISSILLLIPALFA